MLVVHEEVAIKAEVSLGQDLQGALASRIIVGTAFIQRRDEAHRQAQVVSQLCLLRRHDAAFHQAGLFLFQLAALSKYEDADEQHREDQRQHTEGDDLVLELHGLFRGEEELATPLCGLPALERESATMSVALACISRRSAATNGASAATAVARFLPFAEERLVGHNRLVRVFALHVFHVGVIVWHADQHPRGLPQVFAHLAQVIEHAGRLLRHRVVAGTATPCRYVRV
ncbi:hypothetical protein D3C81_1465560 [compost metagenome]